MSALLPDVVIETAESSPTSIGIAFFVTLALLLLAREISDAREEHRAKALSRHLMVALVPFLIAFALTVIRFISDSARTEP